MYITNHPEIACIAEAAGVDRIFIDLEIIGKQERQGGMDSVQSYHTLDDIINVRRAISTAELLVRSNPIYSGSANEINTIILNGADVVMLPYFKTLNEVAKFIDLVGGRAKTCLLVETAEAVEKIDAILEFDGIDEIHIGLNDLHLAYHKKFMFELLVNGVVELLATKIRAKGIPFGFGGIATLNGGVVPGSMILKEHYRLGSSMVIISRSFCNTSKVTDLNEIRHIFKEGIKDIRQLEAEAQSIAAYFSDNNKAIVRTLNEIG